MIYIVTFLELKNPIVTSILYLKLLLHFLHVYFECRYFSINTNSFSWMNKKLAKININ